MPTWSSFRNSVIAAYNEGAQSTDRENAALQAVADYTKSAIERETNGDLQQRQSYLNSYLAAKVALAPYQITSNAGAVLSAVQTRITVDANRSAISNFVQAQVTQGIADFNGTAAIWEAALVEFAMDAQRLIPYYRSRHTTYYTPADFDSFGAVSVAALPSGARPWRFVYELYYPDLGNDPYAVGDYFAFEGFVWLVTTAGSVGDSIAHDETSFEGNGGLVATVIPNPECFHKVMEPYSWKLREQLSCDRCALTDTDVADYTPAQFIGLRSSHYTYSLEPHGKAFWVAPKVRDYWRVQLEWDGIKTAFSDNDNELFGPLEARAAALYIRSILQRTVQEAPQAANTSLQLYLAERKKLWIAADERQRGAL